MICKYCVEHLDYVFFFYGLAFVLLGIVCLGIRSQEAAPIPWKWLAGFGLAHGLNEWLDLGAIDLRDTPLFATLRLCVMIISFAFLVEFARRAMKSLLGKAPGPWILALLVFLGGLGVLDSMAGLNASARYALGFTGSLGAAWALWIASKRQLHGGIWLAISGGGMALYAVATGLLGPTAGFFPASIINQDLVCWYAGYPIQLIRAVLAVAVAFSVWQYAEVHRRAMARLASKKHDSRYASVLALGLLVLLAVGWFVTDHEEEKARAGLYSGILARINTQASAVNPRRVANLSCTPADIANPDYQRLIEQLSLMHEANPYCMDICIMKRVEGRIIYIACCTNQSSRHRHIPGSFCADPPDGLLEAFESSKESLIGPYLDNGESTYMAAAPIRDLVTREPIALLATEESFARIQDAVVHARLQIIVELGALCLVLVAVFLYLTHSRDAAVQLASSERKYRKLFTENQEAMLLVEPATQAILDANPTACRFYGYSRDEMLAKRISDFCIESSSRNPNPPNDASDGKTGVHECRHRLASGEIRDVEISSSLAPDNERVVRHSIILDITARRRAEVELKKSKEMLQSITDGIADSILLLSQKGQIQWANKAALGLYGNAITSQFCWKVTHGRNNPCDEAGCPCPLAVYKKTGSSPVLSHVHHDEQGRANYVEVTGYPIKDEKGEWQQFIHISRNVTERVNAEKERETLKIQLTQAQKMESIGRLAGGIAHDFNNILAVILGYAEMLLEDTVIKEEGRMEPVREIKKAGERAADLTHQLLAFGRKQVLEIKRANLNQIVSDCEKMLRRLIGEDIEIAIALDPALRPIMADTSQITLVLFNLAINARDAMHEGGILTIETSIVHFSQAEAEALGLPHAGEYAKMIVSDTGCGMDEETQKHVFEPFFTTKEIGKGTGLGLATAYGIVKQHGGDIHFHSEMGRGTQFTLCFPQVSENAATEDPLASPAILPRGNETTLVVEDDDSLRRLISEILSRNGYKVLTAAGGREAIRIASERRPIHLLITDVVMPGMNGRQVSEALIVLQPDIKVLYMSGHAQDLLGLRGFLDDKVAFLPKPFTAQSITQKVREALAK